MLFNLVLCTLVLQVLGITVPERIRKNGYPVEIYQNIVTEDKYLLTVFRIPCGRDCTNSSQGKPVVFLMHGLFGTSRDYVIMGPEKGLGYLLADKGYDVWLGNARGSQYSRKHVVLNPDGHSKYWDFSWHEVGYYDLPAILNVIKRKTKKSKLSFVGNSMGATVFSVLTSMRPEYNKEFTVMVALAPAVYLGQMTSPIVRTLARLSGVLNKLGELLNVNEIPPKGFDRLLGIVGELFCQPNSLLIEICRSLFFVIAGFNPTQLNASAVVNIFQDGPSPASRKMLIHYAQNINTAILGYFRQYDFGPSKNVQNYGKRVPPKYDLSKTKVPVTVYYSKGDWICDLKDVEKLCKELANCSYFRQYDFGPSKNVQNYGKRMPPKYDLSKTKVPVTVYYSKGDWICDLKDVEKLCKELANCSKYLVAMDTFNHLDFVFATDVVKYVYENVFNVLDKYNKN